MKVINLFSCYLHSESPFTDFFSVYPLEIIQVGYHKGLYPSLTTIVLIDMVWFPEYYTKSRTVRNLGTIFFSIHNTCELLYNKDVLCVLSVNKPLGLVSGQFCWNKLELLLYNNGKQEWTILLCLVYSWRLKM